jgi:hypothetical protein
VSAAGSVIEYADIGYAENPVFLFIPDGATTLRNCRVHDFANVGIAVSGTTTLGGIIESNTIERGGILAELGLTGVLLDSALNMVVRNNKIDLSQLALLSGSSAAIDVIWSTLYCWVRPLGSKLTLVEGNWIVGPGAGALASHSGIRSTWTCADPTSNIHVKYLRNYIEDFNTAGIQLIQTENLQADSNNVVQSLRSVDISRDSDPTLGGPVANWKGNWFEVTDPAGTQMLRTDNKAQTALGPASSTLGDNGFEVDDTNVNFILENDAAPSTVKLIAKDCYWYLLEPAGEHFLNTGVEVFNLLKTRLKPVKIDYDVDPVRPDSTNPAYFRMSAPPSVGRLLPPALTGTGRPDAGQSPVAAPLTTFLGPPLGNPIRGTTELVLDVASKDEGLYEVAVFDVLGRRVATLQSKPLGAGTYRVRWEGVNSSGQRVPSGIYFVRVEGPGFRRAQKVTLVR